MTSEAISEPAGPCFGPHILTAVLGRGAMGVSEGYAEQSGPTPQLRLHVLLVIWLITLYGQRLSRKLASFSW